jgi:pilus assembly protein Flp/PilA
MGRARCDIRGRTVWRGKMFGKIFNKLRQSARLFPVCDRGVTAIEYALIAALIAVVIIGAVTAMGTGVSGTFNSVGSEL